MTISGSAVSHTATGTIVLAAIMLGGCTTVYEGKYAHDAGWREAIIQKVGNASEIETPQFSDCRKSMPTHQLAATRFALVTFKHMGRSQMRVVPLQAGGPATVGAMVYMNAVDCSLPMAPRR